MWPWEHLAVGYLCYSAYSHLVARHSPRSDAVVVLVVATQLPDLVDKPLAWSLSVLPSGHSLAHSLLTAAPLSAFALALAARANRADVGVAFAVGYCSHLAGDVVYPTLLGRPPNVAFLLWPVVPAPPETESPGLLAQFSRYFGDYLARLGEAGLSGYVALELALLGAVFLLWLYDGMPGLPGRARVTRR
ncbi:metal-dependent hydrolase [Halomicrococcus sp. NG-SE-24]|uniref:metal-dependent hydrolase n=1 Tax=Halomicrococcus sp. NG-SE-24 TaxID=3436928 RepID=UPI003D9763F7